jgi:ParB family chromosome partitioning protein
MVKQRLRLATVSPTLLDVYAEDGMTLEMLMAFTVSTTMPPAAGLGAIKDGGRRNPGRSGAC